MIYKIQPGITYGWIQSPRNALPYGLFFSAASEYREAIINGLAQQASFGVSLSMSIDAFAALSNLGTQKTRNYLASMEEASLRPFFSMACSLQNGTANYSFGSGFPLTYL